MADTQTKMQRVRNALASVVVRLAGWIAAHPQVIIDAAAAIAKAAR
jgi:hypothetical protein